MKVGKSILVLLASSCLLPAVSFAKTLSPSIYRIALMEGASMAQCQESQTSLDALGYSPLNLEVDGEVGTLSLGEFPYYVDALLVLDDLKERGFNEAKIVSEDNTSIGQLTYAMGTIPGEKKLIALGSPSSVEKVSDLSDSAIEEVNKIIAESDTNDAISQIKFMQANRSDDDPVKGVMELRVAYLNCRKGDKETAKGHFKRIVDGDIAAPKEIQVEASGRLARIYHAQKDRKSAYECFRAVSEITNPGEIEHSEALKSLGGLMMELARSDKGTLKECQVFYQNALEDIPVEHVESRAIIGLMYAESFYYAGDNNRAIQECEAYLENTELPLRERATCMLFLGHAYAIAGDVDLAEQTLSQILDMELAPKDKWKHIPDIKLHALKWLRELTKNADLDEKYLYWSEVLKSYKEEIKG
jgi:tetratricopeptide (TPR) repeat protein